MATVSRGNFEPKRGPIFANFVLADEINRAPAKLQSALLEAMRSAKSPSVTRHLHCPIRF